MLTADSVTFAYDGRPVVEEVSLRIGPGAIVGVLGPNGSGKTTLLRLLSGGLDPASGRVELDGVRIGSIGRRTLARRVAVVPQETSLAFDYSVLEIALMGRYPHLGTFEIEGPADLAAAMGGLESTGTAALAERPFRTLSGGEKQRVVIASALAQIDGEGPPPMLLLDEPTASLDLKYQFEVAALVRRLNAVRGITIVLSTHDLRFAASVCSEVVLLSRGRVLAQGPTSGVLTPALAGQLFDVDTALVAPLLSPAGASA